MATFTITANGTKTGIALAAASTALFFGGVFDGAKVRVEASPNNALWAPVVREVDINTLGKEGGVLQCALPSGWFVRTVTITAGAATNITAVIA